MHAVPTFALAVDGTGGADQVPIVSIVGIHALCPYVLVSCASDNLHGVLLWTLVVDGKLSSFGVVHIGPQGFEDVILDCPVSYVEPCKSAQVTINSLIKVMQPCLCQLSGNELVLMVKDPHQRDQPFHHPPERPYTASAPQLKTCH